VISIEEARSYIFSLVSPLAPQDLPTASALGCVAGSDVIAREPVPGFANSSMDGFAVRSDDTIGGGATLQIVDLVLAGGPSSSTLGPGEAMRIMTGAPIPDGADAVEMLEEVDVDDAAATVSVTRAVAHGAFVRRRGDDIAVGDRLVASGDVLHASRLGVLASQGLDIVRAVPRPRVGVLSTGNELSSEQGPLVPGAIRDVNRPLLMALLGDTGVTPVDLGVVRDDYRETLDLIAGAADSCDAVITTGGVSVGDVDYVKAVITELGGETARAMQIAVRPGKPFAFGALGTRRVPVFGLPGNPVSTRVSYELFVRPALRRLGGHARTERMVADAILDCEMPRRPDGRVHIVHVDVAISGDERVHVIRAMREGSHLLQAVAPANAMAIVPDGGGLSNGDVVRVIVLHPDDLSPSSEWDS